MADSRGARKAVLKTLTVRVLSILCAIAFVLIPIGLPPAHAEDSSLAGIVKSIRERIFAGTSDSGQKKGPPAKTPASTIAWTAEQLRWRSDHPLVRIVLQRGTPYFETMQNGQYRGFFIEYLELLAAAAGIKLQWEVSPPNTQETLSSLDHGVIDVVVTMPQSRLHYARQMDIFDISMNELTAIFVNGGSQTIGGENGLHGLTIAVTVKYPRDENIRQFAKTNNFITAADIPRALQLVATKKAAAALLDAHEGGKLLADPSLQHVKIAGYVVAKSREQGLTPGIVLRSDFSILATILAKAIDALDDRQRARLYGKWFEQSEAAMAHPGIQSGNAVWWLFGFGILAFLMFLLVSFIMLRFLRDEAHAGKLGSRRFRLMILAGLSGYLLVTGMIGVESLRSIKSRIMLAVDNNLRGALHMANDTLELWVEEKLSFLARMAADQGIVAITGQLVKLNNTPENLQRSAIVRLCQSMLDEDPYRLHGSGYSVLDLNYNVRCAGNPADLGRPSILAGEHREPLIRVSKGESVFIPFHRRAQTTEPRPVPQGKNFLAYFLAPIRNNQGLVIGVLVIQNEAAGDFSYQLNFIRRDTSLENYAINQDGIMMTNSRFDRELRQAGLLSAEQRSGGFLPVRDPGGDLTRGFLPQRTRDQQPLILIAQKTAQLRQRVINRQPGGGPLPVEIDLAGSRDYRGVEVFGAWLWNPYLELGITASIDTGEAMANFVFVRKILVAILGMTLLMSTGLTLLTLSIGERIRKILSAARDNLDEKVRVRTVELELQKEQMKVAESHYRQILSSMDEGLIEVDMDNQIVYVNGAALSALGFAEEELLGGKMHQLLHHSFADGRRNPELGCEICMTARDGQSRVVDEDLLWKKDGTFVSVEYSVTPVIKDGFWRGALVVFRDITDQLATRKQLVARERQFQMLIESAPDPLIIADAKGIIVIVNQRAESMFGYERDEMIGSAVEMLLPEDKRQAHHGYRQKYLENPSLVEMGKSKREQHGLTKDGRTIPLEIGLSVIETDGGILIASSLRDISERQRNEQQIRDSETRLALAAEAGGLGMWEWRIADDSFFMSDFWRKIKGLPDDVMDYSWQRWEEGIVQEDRARVKEILEHHLAGKSERFEAEYRFYRTFDDWYWEHVSGRVIEREADGRPVRMVGYVHDITSRKLAEEALSQERERLQRILDTSPVYVGIVCAGVFRFANHRLFLRFGITAGDREAKLYVDQDEYEHITLERSVKQVIRNRELQLYNKNGEVLDMLASFLATSYEDRDASLCWLIDVTMLKETERELRNKVDELARFRRLAVGREQRMLELKQEINTVLTSRNLPPKYTIH